MEDGSDSELLPKTKPARAAFTTALKLRPNFAEAHLTSAMLFQNSISFPRPSSATSAPLPADLSRRLGPVVSQIIAALRNQNR